MSYDTLFITDLHGNIDALRRAVTRATASMDLRHLMIGGDIAPNLITVQLRDGEYVLRHESVYGASIQEDFRSRLRAGKQYRSNDQHGKRSVKTTIDADVASVLSLGDDETRALLAPLSTFDFLRVRQRQFVEMEFLPLLQTWIDAGIEIFVMLGNDDFAELESLLLEHEHPGRLTSIHNRVVSLGTGFVLGYSCVLSKPFRYRYWERSEEEFSSDLARLIAKCDTSKTVLSIHMPPHGTNLDMVGTDGSHVGSHAVRRLIQDHPVRIGLFGHIHESHLVSGSRHDRIGDVDVINPGGYHDDECCAVVFDSNQPSNWVGLW